jgi:CBS domain-containing protein
MAVRLSTPRGAHEFDEETRRVIGRTVAEIMTEDLDAHVVAEDTPLEEVAAKLAREGTDPLVVLRRGRLAGLITRTALVRLVVLEESPDR